MKDGQLCQVVGNILPASPWNRVPSKARVYRVGSTAGDKDYLMGGTVALLIEYDPNSQCKILANEELYYIAASSLKELETEE